MIVVSGEYPKDCLHCNYRHCLHIGEKYYQMCGLNGDGYLTESWFKSEDLVGGFKSKHCPIQGEYEEVFNHDLSVEQCENCKKDWTKCGTCSVMMQWVKEMREKNETLNT